jgi:hypothetical protein
MIEHADLPGGEERSGGRSLDPTGSVWPAALDGLVEAWIDREEARWRLEKFRGGRVPPVAPVRFEYSDAYTEHHRRRQFYEAELGNLEGDLALAESRYSEAAGLVPEEVLPEGAPPLRHAYGGEREELRGRRYAIERRHGGIAVGLEPCE